MDAETSRRRPSAVPRIELIGITGIPEIKAGDELASMIVQAAERQGTPIESGDILVRDLVLPRVSSGNLIAIPAVGAYCPSMASTYNLNPRPAMVLVCDGNGKLIRRRETYEDLQSCDLD